LIFNESEAVRDRHSSLQWVVLLFTVFLDSSADETLQNISPREISVDKKKKGESMNRGNDK